MSAKKKSWPTIRRLWRRTCTQCVARRRRPGHVCTRCTAACTKKRSACRPGAARCTAACDGYEYKCGYCWSWQPRSAYFEKSRGRQAWGLDYRCRTCEGRRVRHLVKGRRRRGARNRYHSRTSRRNKSHAIDPQHDRQYAAWLASHGTRSYGLLVPAAAAAPLVAQLIAQHESVADAARAAGVDEAVLRRIVSGAVASVEYPTAERLFMAAGALSSLDAVAPVPGRVGWNRAGDTSCHGCGTFFHPHWGKGLCQLCYNRQRNQAAVHGFGYRHAWAREWDRCTDCGTTERKHRSGGRCDRCDHRHRIAERLAKHCALCGEPINRTGRPTTQRKYCSPACRQRAHYERKKLTRRGGP